MPHLLARVLAGLAGFVLLAGISACDPKSDPITPRGAGFQQTASGDLAIWFGVPCRDVTAVELEFNRHEDDTQPALTYVLRAPSAAATNVTGLTVGEPVDGLRADGPLPADFDWRDYYSVELLVRTARGQAATYLVTRRLTDESADHPRELYVQDQGWFAKRDLGTAGGKDFRALCSSINPG